MKQRLKPGDTFVPARPFQQYIENRVAELAAADTTPTGSNTEELGPVATIAMELFGDGRTEESAVRRMYRFRHAIGDTATKENGRKKSVLVAIDEFPRSVVENALHRVHPDLFFELYPQYAHERDITLEPDAFCPFCEEMVTPIDGLCPWCTCEHGHLFREVGVTDDGFACLACAKKEHQERSRKAARELAARKRAA